MYVIKKRIKKKRPKKLKRGLLMAGLSLALLSQPAMSEGRKWTFNEEKWKEVKAYGRTIISEDSAREWGPWTEFIQPAAGLIPIAALPGMPQDGAQYFRPESAHEYSPPYTLLTPPLVPSQEFCQSGEWCGYIAYESGEYQYEEGYEWYGPSSGRIALTLTPDNPEEVSVDGGEGYGIASYRVTDLSGNPVHQSGDLDAEFYDGLGDFEAEREDEGTEEDIWGDHPFPWATRQATEGWALSFSYQDGAEGWAQGPYVAGIITPLADIANLQAGNVTADYYGYSSGWYYGDSYRSPVHIEVNFFPGTWNGSWNNGRDGEIIGPYVDSNGTASVYGQVGFNAGGAINGADIVSDPAQFSAGDGTIDASKSVVQGSFFGDNAATLGGVVDITKTTEGYENARHVDVFITCKECVD